MVIDEAVRSAVLWCPDWPIVAFGYPPSDAVAVVHANRVVACSVEARRVGVERGLRRRESQRRCPSLKVLERDLQAEARAFERIVNSLDGVTPRVEVVRPGMVVFATRGPSRYFGGDHAMAKRCSLLVDEALDGLGPARVGVADGAFAASLAARRSSGSIHVVPKGESAQFLEPLSVRTLDRPELAEVLTRLGLHTLGQFAELSIIDVVGRFGAEGKVAHRLASGLDQRPPSPTDPPPDMEVSSELDPPVNRVDQAAFVGKVLADQLLERLDARGVTCTKIVISAETEHGEVLVRCWHHEGSLSAAAVADRVRWQLDGWLNGSSASRPSGGLIRLSVYPDEVIAARGRQLGFWGGQTEAAERASRVVARVQGLLGVEAVKVPERGGGRSPHEQVLSVIADTVDLNRENIEVQKQAGTRVDTSRKRAEPWPGSLPGPAPARLHNPPVSIEVVDSQSRTVRVDARALVSAEPSQMRVQNSEWEHIQSWAGPWPLDERWWNADRQRRRARFQLVVSSGTARMVAVEGGHWWLEATYD